MKDRIHLDKVLLENLYINNKYCIADISILTNVPMTTVARRLREFNIKTRPVGPLGRDLEYDTLYKLYIKEENSPYTIAKILNCSPNVVRHYLQKYNIPIRNKSESQQGSRNHRWKSGISNQRYCYKFNDSFKEHIRDKFERTCYICGKHEDNCNTKLSVHHIDYNKNSICNGNEFAFIPLCRSCHAKTNNKRWYYYNLLIYYWINKYMQFWGYPYI